MFYLIWLGSIIATIIIADAKRLNMVLFVLLGIFFPVIGMIITLFVPSKKYDKPAYEKDTSSFSLHGALQELTSIKNSLSWLQNRVAVLEKNINTMLSSTAAEAPVRGETVSAEVLAKDVSSVEVAAPAEKEVTTLAEKPESFEFVFGKYWLNRIGVLLFFLGVAFFISYTFQYLNAVAKICIGYCLAVGFFVWGNFLEKKERYRRIAWGILGGSWGLLYLSTYAMYYIEATKILRNPLAELVFLAAVSFVAIVYNLKYRSWIVTAMTFLLAFLTVGLGGIEYSTIVYCALIIGSIVYLAYSFGWYELLVFGIAGVYFTYMHWLAPQIFASFLTTRALSVPVVRFHLSFGIVTVSWILFSLGFLLLKGEGRKWVRYLVSGTLMNAGFYVLLGLGELYRARPHLDVSWDIQFWFLIVLAASYFLFALVYKMRQRTSVIVCNAAIAFSFIAMAALIRFPRLSVAFFWILEMAIIFALGIYYKEFVYRIIAAILSIIIVFRLFIVDFASHRLYEFFGMVVQHNVLIFVFAALCFFVMGTLSRRAPVRTVLKEGEVSAYSSFIVFGTGLLVMILVKEAVAKWLSPWWVIEGVGLLGVGFLLRDRVYRICALSVLLLSCVRLLIFDLSLKYSNNGNILISSALCFFVLGALAKVRAIRTFIGEGEASAYRGFIVFATGLLVLILQREVAAKWLSLWWAVEGVGVLGAGFLLRDRVYRICGLSVLSLSCLRLVFVDMAGVDTIYRIIAFIVLGAVLLGASFVYSKVMVKTKNKDEQAATTITK